MQILILKQYFIGNLEFNRDLFESNKKQQLPNQSISKNFDGITKTVEESKIITNQKQTVSPCA